jgi:hypothetical protein
MRTVVLRLAALAFAALALPAAVAASPTPLVVVVQAPDGTAIVPVSSFGEWHRILPNGTTLVEHGDAAVRAVPAIHVARGDKLLVRISSVPTEVKIAHAGAPYGETVAPAGEVAWTVPAEGVYPVSITVSRRDQGDVVLERRGFVFYVTTTGVVPLPPHVDPVAVRPHVVTRRGTAFLDSPARVRLCRGESVRVVLGYTVSRVRGTGFGRGTLTLVERESGTLEWTLRATKGRRAVLSAWDRTGTRHDHAFTYRVSRCA